MLDPPTGKTKLAYVEQVWPSLSLSEARTLADGVARPSQQAKILIVDDERPIVETLRYNLERVGTSSALRTMDARQSPLQSGSSLMSSYWTSCFQLWMVFQRAPQFAR